MTSIVQPAYENSDTVKASGAPPQRPPPPPPLKLPLDDAEELQSRNKSRSTHTSYSPQSDRHHSKSSLEHELRQYQQYSQRIHKLADSSVESLVSYGKSRAETEGGPPQKEHTSLPVSNSKDSDKRHNSRQEQPDLVVNASSDHVRPESTRGGEFPKVLNNSVSQPQPTGSLGQGHSNTGISLSNTAMLLPPASSTMRIIPSQSVPQNNLSSAQTKDSAGNETRRKSNDSVYWQSANSHNSSFSLSEEESQVRSADAVPPHSIITRPNPKIISIVGNQRRSEPTRNLSPVVLQPRGHHSASALGFGGPSDWEHFGDYETEEIDDTDLYSRSKPNIVTNIAENAADSAVDKATELPVDVTPVDKPQSPKNPEQVMSGGIHEESPLPLSRDMDSLETTKPEHRFESPKPKPSVESPKHEQNIEPSKTGRTVESPKPGYDVDSPKSGFNAESSKHEIGVEPSEPENRVESLQFKKSVEPFKSEQNVEPFKPEKNIEPFKPEKSVEPFKAEKNVALLEFDQKVEPSKPEQNIALLTLEKNVEPSKSGRNTKPFKPEQDVAPLKLEQTVEPCKSGHNVEPFKPEQDTAPLKLEQDVEPSKSDHSVEHFKPEKGVEPLEPEKNVKPFKLEQAIELPKPEQGVEPSIPEQGVEPLKVEKSMKPSKPNQRVELSNPGQSIESPKPEKVLIRSGDKNGKATGTESQVEASLLGSTRSQALQMKAEEMLPHRQSSEVEEVVEIRLDDSIKDKAVEYQPPSAPLLVDDKPSCNQPAKTLPENRIEPLPRGDTPSDQSSNPHQEKHDDLLRIKPPSSQIDESSLVKEIPAVPRASQCQAPQHGKIDNEDSNISSVSIANLSEVKQTSVWQELSIEQGVSRRNDVADSSEGPKSNSQRGTIEENINAIPIKTFKPISPNATDRAPTSSTRFRRQSASHQGSPLRKGRSLRRTEIDDIYEDLDPWGRASLHRYISMLHEEAKAKTDLEKFRAFTVFANRETKLRAVLYAVDDDAATVQTSLARDESKDAADPTAKRSEKALPALPPGNTHPSSQILERSPGDTVLMSEPAGVPEDVDIALTVIAPSIEPLYSAEGNQPSPQETKEENPTGSVPELNTPRERVNKVWTQFANYIYSSQSSSPEVPKIVIPGNTDEPPKPAYVPYKNNQTEAEIDNYLSKRQSTYRPYAALTMSSLESGLCLATESDKREGTLAESFALEVQEEGGQNNRTPEPETSSLEVANLSKTDGTIVNLDLRRFVKSDFDPLCSVLPSSGVIIQDSVELQQLHGSMDAFPDDFGFIRESVLGWDAVAKKERERFERERHIRQGESERKIDELFDSHEIGYGDISELEAEFKQSEASRKADEDRHEYHTFLSNVFDVVWTQLHYEIDHLTPLYQKYTTLIKDSLVGKDMFEVSTAQFTLPPLMSALLALHQKLEVRHQKAFEAVLERDRRLKKTEISAWYTLGNISKVKELEKQFEGAEKNALVAYCQHRDERANKLMDVLDHNTLRGVGANQDYMECLLKAVRRVASGRASASIPSSDPGVGIEEVKKAKSITTALSTSSEQIVRTFHVADMLLNAADYELSVAKAKLVNASAETFKRLKEERKKEDQRLMRDLEHRLARIREDTRKTHDEVTKLLAFLGVENGQSDFANPSQELTPLSKTEELVQRALLNATKIPTPGGAEE